MTSARIDSILKEIGRKLSHRFSIHSVLLFPLNYTDCLFQGKVRSLWWCCPQLPRSQESARREFSGFHLPPFKNRFGIQKISYVRVQTKTKFDKSTHFSQHYWNYQFAHFAPLHIILIHHYHYHYHNHYHFHSAFILNLDGYKNTVKGKLPPLCVIDSHPITLQLGSSIFHSSEISRHLGHRLSYE